MTRHWHGNDSFGATGKAARKPSVERLTTLAFVSNQTTAARAIADRPAHPERFILLQAFFLQYFRHLPKTADGLQSAQAVLPAATRNGSIGNRRLVLGARRQRVVAKHRLTVEIGAAMRMLARLGFYATVPTFFELSQHLANLIDGRTDGLFEPTDRLSTNILHRSTTHELERIRGRHRNRPTTAVFRKDKTTNPNPRNHGAHDKTPAVDEDFSSDEDEDTLTSKLRGNALLLFIIK